MYVKYKDVSSQNTEVRFSITQLDNGTFIASILQTNPSGGSDVNRTGHNSQEYDDEGALIYVCAVIFIYAFSIILMIGSLIKKNMHDHGVTKYMKDIDKLRRLERRQEKFKTRLAMQKKRFRNILGSDRAVLTGSGRSEINSATLDTCDSLASVFTEVPPAAPLSKEPLTHDRAATLSLPLQLSSNAADVGSPSPDKTHQRSLSCDADVQQDRVLLVSTAQGSVPPVLHQSNQSISIDIPEVTVDLCDKELTTREHKAGCLLDTSVVSAFILPTPPANVEPGSPKLEVFGRKLSSSSLGQLQPLLEADEEAIIV